MASYNGGKFIVPQVQSILSQLQAEDELIVSDDNSNDDTIKILQEQNDCRIKIIRSDQTRGVVRNFEIALNAAKGDQIFLADQDDLWLNDKVAVCLKYLKDYDVVQSDATIVDATLHPNGKSLFMLKESASGFFRNLWRNNYVGCTMSFNRKVLDVALPFPKNIPMHDQWIGIVGELAFSTYFIPEVLMLYRRHDLAQSSTGFKSPYSLVAKTIFRLNIIRHVGLIVYRRYFSRVAR